LVLATGEPTREESATLTAQQKEAGAMEISSMVALDALHDWLLVEHSHTTARDRLASVRKQLTRVIEDGVSGAVVELGCYRGATSVWMRAILDSLGEFDREIHVFDSFEGLPDPGNEDGDFHRGGEVTSTIDEFLATHDKWSLRHPVVHPGWFSDTLATQLPDRIAFGYLDGDFYDSITVSLNNCVPRMAPGGALLIDDYADTEANPRAWDKLPGVKKACDDFFSVPSPVQAQIGEGIMAHGLLRFGPNGPIAS
jgi:O-methyltransferase